MRFMAILACLSLTMLATSAAAEPEPEVKPSDTDVLTIFRHGADAHGILAANRSDALSHLRGNRLNGTLDTLQLGVPNLALLYLSRNDLSGNIPGAIARLPRLLRVDLADNSLSGAFPATALANLTGHLTLKLQDNLLTGLLLDISAALPHLATGLDDEGEVSARRGGRAGVRPPEYRASGVPHRQRQVHQPRRTPLPASEATWPPEQADDKRLSQEADVYSFGVLILEALTGKAPAQHPPPDGDAQRRDRKGASALAAPSLPEWVREEWTSEVFDAELLRYRNVEE
ncbi:hypothetical protein ACP70R_047932 [Stipagrostis hirtigluma subsp. patula]